MTLEISKQTRGWYHVLQAVHTAQLEQPHYEATISGGSYTSGWALGAFPFQRWPGHSLSVPVGLALYPQPDQANALNVPDHSRSQLARDTLDFVAEQ
jgi:hypothetical protein